MRFLKYLFMVVIRRFGNYQNIAKTGNREMQIRSLRKRNPRKRFRTASDFR
jgi:hypothetical protein